MSLFALFACTCAAPAPNLDTGSTPKGDLVFDTASPNHDDPDFYSGEWEIPERSAILAQADLLPRAEDGSVIAHEDETGALLLHPESRTPLTGAAGCAALVMACWDPTARSIAACLARAPRCATEEPWNEEALCCHETCLDRYLELRDEGQKMTYALPRAVFDSGSCMPGVDAYTGGE